MFFRKAAERVLFDRILNSTGSEKCANRPLLKGNHELEALRGTLNRARAGEDGRIRP